MPTSNSGNISSSSSSSHKGLLKTSMEKRMLWTALVLLGIMQLVSSTGLPLRRGSKFSSAIEATGDVESLDLPKDRELGHSCDTCSTSSSSSSSSSSKSHSHSHSHSGMTMDGIDISINEDSLMRCYDNMLAADSDFDGDLSADEYADFIALQSNGTIDLPFELLSPTLIYIFYSDACFVCYHETEDCDCCIGDLAKIEVDGCSADQLRETLYFVCINADKAIACETQPPSIAPTESMMPSGVPSPMPSISPSPTLVPSPLPTDTMMPSGVPSPVPTATDMPSGAPSPVPTATDMPSGAPSPVPTATDMPSGVPSPVPTTTDSPSASPTEGVELLCLQFSFGLNNDEGLTPQDILTMNGNTLKTGLEIATAQVVSDILNETFHDLAQFSQIEEDLAAAGTMMPTPEMDMSNSTMRMNSGAMGRGHHRRTRFIYEGAEVAVYNALIFLFGRQYARVLMDTYGYLIDLRASLHFGRYHRQLVERLQHFRKLHEAVRRLVYYTDRFPPELIGAVDNPNCPDDGETECAILTIETCVVLEEGDNDVFIEKCLEAGLRYALLAGEFQNAIPSENIP